MRCRAALWGAVRRCAAPHRDAPGVHEPFIRYVFLCAAIQFQICIQNRYKLNKKYRKLLTAYGDEVDSLETKTIKGQAKVSTVRLLGFTDTIGSI